MAATKAELFERIRRDSWREGLSVRALARRYGVHRRLVREALTHAEPAPWKTPGKPHVRAAELLLPERRRVRSADESARPQTMYGLADSPIAWRPG